MARQILKITITPTKNIDRYVVAFGLPRAEPIRTNLAGLTSVLDEIQKRVSWTIHGYQMSQRDAYKPRVSSYEAAAPDRADFN